MIFGERIKRMERKKSRTKARKYSQLLTKRPKKLSQKMCDLDQSYLATYDSMCIEIK